MSCRTYGGKFSVIQSNSWMPIRLLNLIDPGSMFIHLAARFCCAQSTQFLLSDSNAYPNSLGMVITNILDVDSLYG